MAISLISVLVFLIVVALLVYIIRLIPLPAPFQQIAYAVIAVLAVLWLIGLLTGNSLVTFRT